jgi:hypothetical protein
MTSFAQSGQIVSSQLVEEREDHIQKALQLRAEENYQAAIAQIDIVLSQDADDAPILLLKGDLLLQSKMYEEAANTYKQLLPLEYEQSATQINLSYALFMSHKPSKALIYAIAAWQQDSMNTNAIVNHFNALLWNGKSKRAASFLKQQESKLKQDQVLVMKARLFTSSANYIKGLEYYDHLVNVFPDKNYTKEYVDVLIGKKAIARSEQTLLRSKDLFSSHEYQAIERKINNAQFQNIGTEFTFFKDIAKNIRIDNSAWWQQKQGLKYRFGVRTALSTLTSAQGDRTRSRSVGINIEEKWGVSLSGRTDITFQNISFGDDTKFKTITGKQSIEYQPSNRRMYGVFYSSDILNFTASLLEKNIRSNSIGYTTHIMFDSKNGFYSQGSWGTISDQNQRTQFFGSFYHLFRTNPLLKAGVNFSTLHFKDNEITAYFSPDKYKSAEIFADYNTTVPGLSRFFFKLQTAYGFQKIEQNSWEPAFRLQTELSMHLKNLEASVKYQTSNVASGNGTGYQYDWLSFRLIWKWF